MTRNRVAVDIGGTFTDLVAVADGHLELAKTPTTPGNFAEGVVDSLGKVDSDLASFEAFVHGTTIVINAITERAGVELALITTDGFRDVLDITRANRPDMFNFRYEKPDPFVQRRNRWEVEERVDQAGEVLTDLSEEDVREAVRQIRDVGIESIAVAYLNAYANPVHERRTRDLIEEVYPQAYVTLSHELTQEYREYERTSTAVLNAYVHPLADIYLSRLERRLVEQGMDGTMYVMKSNAGTSSFGAAKQTPIAMVESGPVGGVFGATELGEQLGEPNVISFDMGGTTAKTSLVEDGQVTIETDYWLEQTSNREGYPLKVPVVDIVEIGAGGGSIAWVDQGGSLNVGPRSAGADPGPACYGEGGIEPTVTDANLVTGRLNPDYFLGGEMALDASQARAALEPLASHFDTSVQEAAHGVLQVVNSNMANALKQVSIRRGYDPRDFILVASGGAGGLHAPALGRELGVKEVVVPRAPGQFSAWGMLMTDLRRDYVRTIVMPFEPSNADTIQETVADMEADAADAFCREEVDPTDVLVERYADLRYHGQEHTVTTRLLGEGDPESRPLESMHEVDRSTVQATIDRFHERHERTYNFSLDDPVEVVNLRVTAISEVPKPSMDPLSTTRSLDSGIKETREVDYAEEGIHEAVIYERNHLPAGAEVGGPAVVEEPACTTLVHPDQLLTVDGSGALRIS